MGTLADVPLDRKLFKNIDGDALTSLHGALENCFVTEGSGLSRFPGLKDFSDLNIGGDVHLGRNRNDMIAVETNGRTFRIDTTGAKTAIDGPPVLGGDRVSFARTREGLLMAAGSQIIKYDGVKNDVLSPDAPLSSFVGYVDGYAMAVEKGSGRFQYSELNKIASWPGLNTFGVDGSPDDISAMLVTPYNEILFSGEESIEQFERLIGGTIPFFRRWSISDGIVEPWTLCYAGNNVWGLNDRLEFVVVAGQTTQSASDDIGKEIEDRYGFSDIGSLDNAWASQLYVKGQKFIVFQSPEAENVYGTKGFTAVLDVRRGQWFEIFGWDADNGVPDLWPGRSVIRMWGKTYIGGKNGKIYEMDSSTYQNGGATQRVYMRTAHFDSLGTIRINKVRITVKRGVGSYTEDPKIMFRTNPDHKGFGNMQTRSLGMTGDEYMIIEFGSQGMADTFQFEISCTDNAAFELRRLQLDVDKVKR